MARFPDLPEEILLQISQFFLFDDLTALSLTARFLNKAVYDRLQYHLSLKREYDTLSDLSWSSEHFRLGWFDVLAELLKQSFPPEYITRIKLSHFPWYWDELSTLSHLTRKAARFPYDEEDMTLVVRAALSSPWIYRDGSPPAGVASSAHNISKFVSEIKEGDVDNIVAVLLPLLPNLQHLEFKPVADPDNIDDDRHPGHCTFIEQLQSLFNPVSNRAVPIGFASVPGIVSRVAADLPDPSCRPGNQRLEDPSRHAAFQNLRSIRFDYRNVSRWQPASARLSTLIPWMSLRSVEAIEAFGLMQDADALLWPGKLPKSRVKDVRLLDTSEHLNLEQVVSLAKYCEGPCLFTHRTGDGELVRPADSLHEWQAVKVEADGTLLTLGGILP